MRKQKVYRIYFKTRNLLTGARRDVHMTVIAFSLVQALCFLRNKGYTISRDYYYYVEK